MKKSILSVCAVALALICVPSSADAQGSNGSGYGSYQGNTITVYVPVQSYREYSSPSQNYGSNGGGYSGGGGGYNQSSRSTPYYQSYSSPPPRQYSQYAPAPSYNRSPSYSSYSPYRGGGNQTTYSNCYGGNCY